jgi:hypothetical protein
MALMGIRGSRVSCALLLVALAPIVLHTQDPASSSSSSSKKHVRKPAAPEPAADAGVINNGVYRNKTLGFFCTIPAGWVSRTEEMNAREEDQPAGSAQGPEPRSGRVLLAAFSRPPEARAEDVNASIVIAAESVASYPGLKEAVQYFGPVTEAAKAQGFTVANEPYEFAVGTKTLGRADFQKDVGTRVMRQSTLVMLARGEALSFTFIGGTEDEVEELVAGLSFAASRSAGR